MIANILDASALLALIRRETGWQAVDQVVGDAAASTINVGEVARRLLKLGWQRGQAEEALSLLGMPFIDVDFALALDAADMDAITRPFGLSAADRICLALAKRESAVAVTADGDWAKVSEALGVQVRLIR